MSNKVELPLDICNMIADYHLPKYVLHDWIDINKLNWDWLSGNANAIELLKENYNKINWALLSGNPAAIQLLKENPDKIDWRWLSRNTAAIDLLLSNPDRIDWLMLSKNPAIFKPIRDQNIVDILYEL